RVTAVLQRLGDRPDVLGVLHRGELGLGLLVGVERLPPLVEVAAALTEQLHVGVERGDLLTELRDVLLDGLLDRRQLFGLTLLALLLLDARVEEQAQTAREGEYQDADEHARAR